MKPLVAFSIVQTIAIVILAFLIWSGPDDNSAAVAPVGQTRDSLDEFHVRDIVREEFERLQATRTVGADATAVPLNTKRSSESADAQPTLEATRLIEDLIDGGTMGPLEVEMFRTEVERLPPEERHQYYRMLSDAVTSGDLQILR